ncbi:DUF6248 family natural product biosynthesis protein [Streptomyces griseoincarnatus]
MARLILRPGGEPCVWWCRCACPKDGPIVVIQVPAGDLPHPGRGIVVLERPLDHQQSAGVGGLHREARDLDGLVLRGRGDVDLYVGGRRLVLESGRVHGGLHLEAPRQRVRAVQDGRDLVQVQVVDDADTVAAEAGAGLGHPVADGERRLLVLVPLPDLLVGVAALPGAEVVEHRGDESARLCGPVLEVGDVSEAGVAGQPLLALEDDPDGILPPVVPDGFDGPGGQGAGEGAGHDEVVDLVDHAGDGVDCPAGASLCGAGACGSGRWSSGRHGGKPPAVDSGPPGTVPSVRAYCPALAAVGRWALLLSAAELAMAQPLVQ